MVHWWQVGVIIGAIFALYLLYRVYIWYVTQYYGDL